MSKEAQNIVGLYRRHAQAWVTLRGQSGFAEKKWLDTFVGQLPGKSSVLDIGSGSGAPVGRYLLDMGIAVTGIDTAPELIAIAQNALPKGQWIVADMRVLALGQKFGGLLAWNSFFHLTQDDQRLMFAVFRKHCAPSAVLMFTSGTEYGEAIGRFQGDPLYHASLDQLEYRELLASHGFEVIDHVTEDPDCGGQTVWLARCIS